MWLAGARDIICIRRRKCVSLLYWKHICSKPTLNTKAEWVWSNKVANCTQDDCPLSKRLEQKCMSGHSEGANSISCHTRDISTLVSNFKNCTSSIVPCTDLSFLTFYITQQHYSAAEQNIKKWTRILINLVHLSVIHPEDDACKFFETSEKSSPRLKFPNLIHCLNSPCNSCVIKAHAKHGPFGGAVDLGTALQTGRSQVRSRMGFFIDLIPPAALWPWDRLRL
jgi:hypothetical protein